MINLNPTFFTFSDISLLIGVVAAISTILVNYSKIFSKMKKLLNLTAKPSVQELAYYETLIKELQYQNKVSANWDKNSPYINCDVELSPNYYLPKISSYKLKEEQFNYLTNAEKIDSSKGFTYPSLENAIKDVDDNVCVVIAPPGGGKSVSLRNLAIKQAQNSFKGVSTIIPIFINLGFYNKYDQDGKLLSFDQFLDEFFSNEPCYSFLINKKWEELVRENRCIFFLDAIDELPRKPGEYHERVKKIHEFIIKRQNIKFILSCRELDYNHNLPYRQILIKPFDNRHIRKYIKKYFPLNSIKLFYSGLRNNYSLVELSKNPFYLHLLCFYYHKNAIFPSNLTELFNFFTDNFILHEEKKQSAYSVSKEEFIIGLSHFAYFCAVIKMSTIVQYDEFINWNSEYITSKMKVIQYAINGGLLKYNQHSGNIHFNHNRFQEYFSSLYIVKRYHNKQIKLPENLFTNLWWRETVLFIAGLDENPDDLVNLIFVDYKNLKNENTVINNLLKLDLLALALNCTFSVFNFKNKELYEQIKSELLIYYDKGSPLDKVKILNALKFDKSKVVEKFIKKALKDKSNWVSENAFFIITGGDLKLAFNPLTVLSEFFRFFIEGRLLTTFKPVLKLTTKSLALKLLFPFYLFFLALNIFCIIGVLFTFYYLFNIILSHLKYGTLNNFHCLRCILSSIFMITVILYFIFYNKGNILKNIICVLPLSLLIVNSSYMPVLKMKTLIICIIVGTIVSLFLKFINSRSGIKEKTNIPSLFEVTFVFFAFNFTIFLFVGKIFSYQILNRIYQQQNISTLYLHQILTFLSQDQVNAFVYIILGFIILAIILLLFRHLLIINYLMKSINNINHILQGNENPADLTAASMVVIQNLKASWAKRIYISTLVKKVGENQKKVVDSILFLDSMANIFSDSIIKDLIYQQLENLERNYRQSIIYSNS